MRKITFVNRLKYYRMCNVLRQLDQQLLNSSCKIVIIKFKPFPYLHSDIDVVIEPSALSNIVKSLNTFSSIKVERREKLKLHMVVQGVEMDLHFCISWWDVPFVCYDWCFNNVVKLSETPYARFLGILNSIYVLRPSADTFVLLLSRLYQDFEIPYWDVYHMMVYGDLVGALELFREFGFSRYFIKLLYGYLAKRLRDVVRGRAVMPFHIFIVAHLEFVFRSKFLASIFRRLMLFAKNIVWYIAKRICWRC